MFLLFIKSDKHFHTLDPESHSFSVSFFFFWGGGGCGMLWKRVEVGSHPACSHLGVWLRRRTMSLVGDGGIYGRDIYGVYGGYTGYMDICVRKDK